MKKILSKYDLEYDLYFIITDIKEKDKGSIFRKMGKDIETTNKQTVIHQVIRKIYGKDS